MDARPRAEVDSIEQILIKREEQETLRIKRKRVYKFVIFFVLLAFYIKLFFVDGYGSAFLALSLGSESSMKGGVGWLAIVFIASIIFIWVPTHLLDQLNWNKPVPGLAFKFFGWVAFITPAVIMVVYYLIR